MKALSLSFLASVALASPCHFDFAKFQRELRLTPRSDEAIHLRRAYLPEVCNLADYYDLTTMEAVDPSEIIVDEYKRKLSQFRFDNLSTAIADINFMNVSNKMFIGFVQREEDPYYRREVREAFYSTVKICQDISRATRPIVGDDYWEKRQLERDRHRLIRWLDCY